MTVMNVDHIDLRVPDVEASVSFFEALGFTVVRTIPAPRKSVEVRLPGEGQITFEIRHGEQAGTVVDHIALRVDGYADSIVELRGAGITFESEPREIAATGRTVTNFLDPHGTRWQLTD